MNDPSQPPAGSDAPAPPPPPPPPLQPPLQPSPPRAAPVTLVLTSLSISASVTWWTGANMDALVLREGVLLAQPWRLITSAMLHLGIAHLVFNLLCIWPFGLLIERTLGPLRFAGLVLLLIAASGTAEYATGSIAIGLSGVVYGLWAFAYFAGRRWPELRLIASPRGNAMMVAWFFVCIALTWTGVLAVANIAHGVGAAIGALAGRAAAGAIRRPRPDHVRWIAVLDLALIAIALGASFGKPYLGVLAPPRPPAYAAAALIQSGRYAEALPLLEKAVAADPSNAGLRRILISVHVELRDFERALAEIYRAVDASPGLQTDLAQDAIFLHLSLAREAEHAADYARALGEARAAVEWSREDGGLLLTAGAYAESVGDRDAAIRYATAALADRSTRELAEETLNRLNR